MRKYGKWLLVLAVVAAVPGVASADGLLGKRKTGSPETSSNQKERNQQQAEQVKQALHKARIDGYDIGIEVVDGVVKLQGNVRKPDHRKRAADVCQRVPGIRRVVNELKYVPQGKVRPAAATLMDLARGRKGSGESEQPVIQQVSGTAAGGNQQIANQIGESLRQVGLAGLPIEASFRNGVVTLSGAVPSMEQRNAAAAAAGRVPGVQSVNNQLAIPRPGMTPPQGMPAPQPGAQFAQAGFGRPMAPAGFPQQGPGMPISAPMAQPSPQATPVSAGPAAIAGAGTFSHPHLPTHAWPAYAQYPNYAAVTYPSQYSASAFPYIGPFYPYPQVPLGWREAKLQWDDGFWSLNFNKVPSVWDVLYHPWKHD